MAWDPAQYLRFADERLRPGFDLLARIGALPPGPIFELGCGTGVHTRAIAERWPDRPVSGVDASPEMLARAAATASRVRWVEADIAAWRADEPAALIFSNATLQWLDDHETLFPRLMAQLAPGGVLAVQMPRNFEAPSHLLIAETALNGPWCKQVQHLITPPPVNEPGFYHDLLAPNSQNIDIWQTEYLQVLEGDNPVKEWTKGTWLTRYLDVLQGEEKAAFEDAYGARVAKAYPKNAAGQTLFPFRRLFMVAQRKG